MGAYADALAKEFDVILVDQRTHGKSSAPETGYRLDNHADDVLALIDALNLHDVMLAGHSLGACVILCVASRNPEKISRIVLIDPPMPDSAQNTDAEKRYIFLARYKISSPKQLRNSSNTIMPTILIGQRTKSALCQKASIMLYMYYRENGAVLDTYWRDEMTKVGAMPVLLLYGEPELGSAIPWERASEAMSILKNGESVMIQGAGTSSTSINLNRAFE